MSTLLHEGAVALVAGGTSGLGLATAQALTRNGGSVVVLGRSVERGLAAQGQLAGRGRFVAGDVANEDQVGAALDVAGKLGVLRVVVNCAGTVHARCTLGRTGPMPLKQFAEVISTDLIGTFNVTRLAAERMAAADLVDGERGVIVNCASVAAFDGQVGQVAYAAAKAGVVGMTLPLARDLASLCIRVVTVAAGLFDTPMMQIAPEPMREALTAQVPHPRRLGRPVEFAALVEHIVTNPMINGETIRLDGALRMPQR